MLKANPIRKRPANVWLFGLQDGSARAVRRWVAVCPHCPAEISVGERNGRGYLRGHTRKQAKDALYHHIQQKHRPGSVGR